MVDAVKTATVVLVIGGGFAGIFAIVLFSIFKIRKINANLAIMVSTLLSCFLMVPVISAFNNLVDIRVEGSIVDEGKAEIQAQRAELERLKAENRVKMLERERLDNQITIAKQSIEIEALNDNIKLLEHAELSMQSFQRILQIALLQTNLKQTLVRKEHLTPFESGWGFKADYFNDEILVILTHDINAKFGVDLNEIKIVKLDGNNVIVSGIRPKYIGSDRYITDIPVKEVRRVNYKKGIVASIRIENNPESLNKADKYAKEYEDDFQRKLSEGLELGFMNDAVVQLAQNFLTVMLAPLYKNIRFTDAEQPGALPLMEYLQKELKDNQNRKIELLETNEDLLLVNEKNETEAVEIEVEQGLLETKENNE
jgi:hypothetical protein